MKNDGLNSSERTVSQLEASFSILRPLTSLRWEAKSLSIGHYITFSTSRCLLRLISFLADSCSESIS